MIDYSEIAEHLRDRKYQVKTDGTWSYMTSEDVRVVLDTLAADLYTRENGDSLELAHMVLVRDGDTATVFVRVGEIPLGEK